MNNWGGFPGHTERDRDFDRSEKGTGKTYRSTISPFSFSILAGWGVVEGLGDGEVGGGGFR
jgi:hypothetical protein